MYANATQYEYYTPECESCASRALITGTNIFRCVPRTNANMRCPKAVGNGCGAVFMKAAGDVRSPVLWRQ